MLKTVSSGASLGGVTYKGTWNASANLPPLASGVGNQGDYYVVSVAGNTNLDGITDWQIGDWAIFNGTVWQKVDNTDAVTSVNGQVGAVVLTAANVGATSNTTYVLASGLLTGGGQLNANVTLGLTTVPVANVPGAVPNTVNIIAGTGLSGGGALTGNVTINNAGVLDFNGRTGNVSLSNTDVITALGYTPGTSNTSGTVTSVTAGTGLDGGTITSSGTINLANTAVVTGTYGSNGAVSQVTIDQQGRITNASNVGITLPVANISGAVPNTVNVIAGTGLTGGGALTGNVTIDMANTAVNAGVYGSANAVSQITVDAQGRITAAANVAIPLTGGTVTSITAGTGLNGGTITTNGTISLANTTVTAGTYGSATGVPQIVVDAQGRITSASNVAIGGASTVVTNVVTILSGSLLSWTNNSVAVITWENNSLQTIGWTSTTYAITNNNATILANCSVEPLSTQLPAAGTVTGQQFIIKKIDSSGNAATVTTTSSQTIDGATTYALSAQYRSVTLQSDGASYWITSKVT